MSQGIMSDTPTQAPTTGRLKTAQWDRLNPSMKQAFSPSVALKSKRASVDKSQKPRTKTRRPAQYPGESYITFDNESDGEGVKSDQPSQLSITSPNDGTGGTPDTQPDEDEEI